MKRENLEKLDNPNWKAAYDAALAKADPTGAGSYDAQAYAAVAADLALADAEDAKAKSEANLAATRARLAAGEAHAREQAERPAAEPAPDHEALLRKAVAGINARRGAAPTADPDETARAAIEGGDADEEAGSPDAIQAGWEKAVDRINASR